MRASWTWIGFGWVMALLARGAETRPNVLLIYADDLGWRDCGFMGSDFYETPNLDRLAGEGMVFTSAYSPAANCAPARASVMTGGYSPRHEVFNVGTRARGDERRRKLLHVPGTDELKEDLATWPELLQGNGYRTAVIGKWHLGDDPMRHGFDVNVGGGHWGSPPGGHYPPHSSAPGLREVPEDRYLTETLSLEAAEFIKENAERPWALYLPHYAVHTPIQPKRDLVAKYEAKEPGELHSNVEMATMIEALDQGVGIVLEALEESGQRERTLIVFFSDNGGYGPATDMDPLKGYKGTYYEGGIRVPMVVAWPGVVPPGRSAVPVHGVDLHPTFCDAAGVEVPAGVPTDGQSLLPLLRGEDEVFRERAIFWHFPAYLESYAGDATEQRDRWFRSRPCSVMRRGRWKLHEFFEDGSVELYDLEADLGETRDLAAERPEVAARMREELAAWRERVEAPVPTEPNPKFDSELTD